MPKAPTDLLRRLGRWWSERTPKAQNHIVGALLVMGTAPVLGLAVWLEPDPAGVGTHRQLGLGGCTVLTLTGWPCPMCGMTTTFTHMAHLDPLAAMQTQPFGVLLFLATATVFLVGMGSLTGATWWRRALSILMAYELPVAAGTLIGMTLGWVYKVVAMGGLG